MASISTVLRYKHNLLAHSTAAATDAHKLTAAPAALDNMVCTYLEIAPCVFLVASAYEKDRQCVIEMVHKPLDNSDRAGSKTNSAHEAQSASSVASIPPALRAAFRIPKVIQLEPDDEGVITTLELLPDSTQRVAQRPSDAQPREALSPLSTRRPTSPFAHEGSPAAVDLSTLHVHLFIGTSNGTVLVANALRGTLLAVAQFQYHHDMLRRRHVGVEEPGEGSPSSSTNNRLMPPRTESEGTSNQAVVRFATHIRSLDTSWNPSLLNGATADSLAPPSSASSGVKAALSVAPECVYVVHSGGKIVMIDRRALDVFVRVCVNRLDGHRPHFSLEWVTSTVSTAFPVAGPAIDFAAFVQFVYTAPAPSHYTEAEKRTMGGTNGGGSVDTLASRTAVPARIIEDAAFFAAPCGSSSLTAPLADNTTDVAGVLLCGRSPAFAAYLLEQQRDEFSASKAMKAVASAVSGMAKNLWRSALGTPAQPAALPRLAKRPQRVEAGVLAADTTITSVLVDATHQWAAMGYESGGRIYLVDLATGAICRVLKGCRAAQFHWTSLALMGKRVSALVVHLPLRNLVEVHTLRLRGRIAACHVESGSVLLRPSPAHVVTATTPSTAHALLMSPSGDIQHVYVDLVALEQQIRMQQEQQQLLQKTGRNADALPGSENTTSTVLLSSCRTPDDFFDLGLQIPLPEAPLYTPSAATTSGDHAERAHHSRYEDVVAYRFRTYRRQLSEVCDAVKRRFAPSYSEPRIIPMPPQRTAGAPVDVHAIGKRLTAAQCLNYLQLRGRLVDAYGQLLASSGDGHVDVETLARRWGGVVPDALWTTTIGGADGKAAQKFWASAFQTWCATSSPNEKQTDWSRLKKLVLRCSKCESSSHDTASADRERAQIPPEDFLSFFYCGDDKPLFLLSRQRAEDSVHTTPHFKQSATACQDALGHLFFAGGSIESFVARLTDITTLGLDIADLAAITMAWIYRSCRQNLSRFLTANNLGALCFVLQLFSDTGFLSALEQVPLELGATASSYCAGTSADGITGLLLSILARQAIKTSASDAFVQSMRMAVQQYLVLLQCLEAHVFEDEKLRGFTLALEELLPRTLLYDCDTLESWCMARGAEETTVRAVASQLCRPSVEKTTFAPDYIALEQAVQPLRASFGTWPWVSQREWQTTVFAEKVLDPLRGQWSESEPAGTTTRRPESDRSALFAQCTVLVYALVTVDRLLQPLNDSRIAFWDFNSVPDPGFLERVQAVSNGKDTSGDRRWLVGSEAARAYLCGVRDAALFAQSCVRSVFGRHVDAMRVVTVIQSIAACLAADDELAFPLVSQTLRRGLRFLMQLSGFNSDLLPYTLAEVLSLLQLLIFWVDLDTLRAGTDVVRRVRNMSVPWRDLYGERAVFFSFFPATVRPVLADAKNAEGTAQDKGAPADMADPDLGFTTSFHTRRSHRTIASVAASSTLTRRFLAAFEPEGTAAVTSASSYDWLESHVLSSGVDRLSAALELQEIVPGFSRLVVLDGLIKRLAPPDKMASVLLSIPDRGLAARVTMRDVGAILACVLKYFSHRRKRFAELQQREAFDQVSLHMSGVLTMMSQQCRQWVKSLIPGSTEANHAMTTLEPLADNGSTASLERAAVGGTSNWFSAGEMDSLYTRVEQIIPLPDDDPAKKQFLEMLCRLAQLSVEGKSRLSRDERRVVDELPAVAEGMGPYLK